MEFENLLEQRRSMRLYKDESLAKEIICKLIHAAQQAPSWKNSQTARYYAVLEKDKIENFAQNCLPEFNRPRTKGASYIVTTFVKNISGFNTDANVPVNECENGWGFYDLGLQNANLILKAKELGLDTLILGMRDAEQIRKMLNIPNEEIIVSVIAVGYGAQTATKPPRKEITDIVKFF